VEQQEWLPIAAAYVSQRLMLNASFWLYQATIFFVIGCHALAALGAWRAIGRWGRTLTLASVALWVALFMRMIVALTSYDPNQAIRTGMVQPFFWWSVAGFLCALVIGVALRRAMDELVKGTQRGAGLA